LIRHVIFGEDGVERLLQNDGSRSVNSDRNLRLEFDAPLRLHGRGSEGRVDRSVFAAADVRWFEGLSQRLGCTKEQTPALQRLGELFARNEHKELARQILELGLKYDRAHAGLLASRVALSPGIHQPTVKQTVDLLPQLSAKEANQIGVALWKAGHYGEAIAAFQRVVSMHPNSATAWANLGVNYEKSGQRGRAHQALATALDLDPFNTFAKESLERLGQSQTNATRAKEELVEDNAALGSTKSSR
jgi:tetratricopeptide (TPR) repeat protein